MVNPKKTMHGHLLSHKVGTEHALQRSHAHYQNQQLHQHCKQQQQRHRYHHRTRWEERSACLAKISPTLEGSLDAAWAGMNQYWDTRGDYDDNICTHQYWEVMKYQLCQTLNTFTILPTQVVRTILGTNVTLPTCL